MSKFINYTVLTGSAFIAGFLAGAMLDKQTKEEIKVRLSSNSDRAEKWLKSHKDSTLDRIERKITEVKNILEKNISDPVPDLYRATESLTLDDDDMPNA